MVHTEGTIRHVWPEDEQHDTDDLNCWCNATSQISDGGIIIVTHNSRDGREYIERLIDKDNISNN